MIKSTGGKVRIEGEINIILADFATIKRAVEELLEENNIDPEEAFGSIDKATQYAELMKSGMTIREAMEIIAPEATDEQLSMMEARDAEYQKQNPKEKS